MNFGKSREKILLSGFRERNKESFALAYDMYVDQIYRFIYFKVGEKEEAQDLTSSVFLKTWNFFQEGKEIDTASLKALLYKIARNAVIDYYRSKNNKINVSLDEAIGVVDEKKDLTVDLEIKMDIAVVETKILELKDEYREAIILRFVDELSITEIAEILDKPKGSIRVLIFRAQQALKKIIDGENKK